MKAVILAGIVSALASAVPPAVDATQRSAGGTQARAAQTQQQVTVFEGAG